MSAVRYALRNGVAVLHVTSPPVNALGAAVRAGLVSSMERALADSATGLVVVGDGLTFPAGADITEFGKPPMEPSFGEVMRAFEDADIPTAAAIHGTALGGGFELAMSCHYRVMSSCARVGLPEVHLGILPGAGGTQRLPRLVGAEAAAEIMVTGRQVSAKEALALGAVDAVVARADLEAEAVKVVEASPVRRTKAVLVDGFKDADSIAKLKARATLDAPKSIIQCVEAAVCNDMQDGLAFEEARFRELQGSTQANALQHLFFAERACSKVPGVSPEDAVDVRAAGVVGGGTMGRGIAMCFVDNGLPVTILETSADAAAAAISGVEETYRRSSAFKRGRLTEEALTAKLDLLSSASDAVFEDMAVKRSIFADLDRVTKPSCVLASNTSTLSIDGIAGAVADPARVVGMHFFSPANVMRLLENVRGARTGPAAVATAMAMGKRLRKTTVLAGDDFGFIGNRMLEPYGPRYGMAMGFFQMSDLAGNDIGYAVRTSLGLTDAASRDPAVEYSADVADALARAGRFGQKVGRGWYAYETPRVPSSDPAVAELIAGFKDASLAPDVTHGDVVDRALLALANEGFRVLEEGLALRPSDIDVVWTSGYGFPRHRGGPMQWAADDVGLAEVKATLGARGPARPFVVDPSDLG
ncbi:enoyl-CoA hydratase [Aureococcus anophagefferens]|nr:enoyl-CoA hydratase [Aureococcus anophagefferens]